MKIKRAKRTIKTRHNTTTIKTSKKSFKSLPQHTTKTATNDLVKTTSASHINDYDCPFYIIRKEDSLRCERFELIYKKNLMCLSAQNSLDGILTSITTMTNNNGHSLNGLIDYIDSGIMYSEHQFKPCPSVYLSRKECLNSEYTDVIIEAIQKSVNNLITT